MSNIHWHEHIVKREDRTRLIGKKNRVIWLTGLSGSGKSTIASLLEKRLHSMGYLTYILDGDNVRHGLNSDLGFSRKDREENIRRVAEVAKLMYDAGITVIVAFISPFRKGREYARSLIGKDFVEVYVKCPLEVCRKRDPKGLYRKAEMGEIREFTGVDSPYEEPDRPEVVVDTSALSPAECVERIMEHVVKISP